MIRRLAEKAQAIEAFAYEPIAAGVSLIGAAGAWVIAARTHSYAPLCGLVGEPHCPACYVSAGLAGLSIALMALWRYRRA
jgi:hypothetical protein